MPGEGWSGLGPTSIGLVPALQNSNRNPEIRMSNPFRGPEAPVKAKLAASTHHAESLEDEVRASHGRRKQDLAALPKQG